MYDPAPLGAVQLSDYEKMPETIPSEDPLLNIGKRELQIALRLASQHDWVADWLFSQSSQTFHPRTAPIPPEAFDNSLAIHLRHNISTLPPCQTGTRSIAPAAQNTPKRHDKGALIVTKDIDLLLVPFANIDGITTGYSFLKGVQEGTIQPPHPASHSQQRSGEFASGRFAFDNAQRDFLMVVNSLSPHMTGIVSMRWCGEMSRERSFFVVPKSNYGPGRLPSRVLSVQCNDENQVPDAAAPDFQFDNPTDCLSTSAVTAADCISSHSHSAFEHLNGQPQQDESECPDLPTNDDDYEPDERDFALQGDADYDFGGDGLALGDVCNSELVNGNHPINSPVDPRTSFALDSSQVDQESWPEGLENFGTIITQHDDQNALLPELLQDFATNVPHMDDVEKILNGISDVLPDPNPMLSNEIARSNKHARSDADESALSPIQALPSSTSELSLDRVFGMGSSWILSSHESTPDGVGIPRRPSKNDRSSGVFDMTTLLGSLAMIERSLKGHFFGRKVRKDILHPRTGELISRCTGEVNADVGGASPDDMRLLRSIAAQEYYVSRMTVPNDARLLAAPPTLDEPYAVSHDANEVRQPTDEPRRKLGRTETQKRPATATLAPRPVVKMSPPPWITPPESLKPNETTVPIPSTIPMDEESTREAKLEAKRIKNRLSAARSNQKRRAQLEAQKKELAQLQERVEELKSKQRLASEENEALKRQVSSRT